jgi:phage terminase large subunit GpA-like protein
VVDYGTFPEMRARYFTLRNARLSLKHVAPKDSRTTEGAILHGLLRLFEQLLSRTWKGADGAEHQVQLCLVDVGYLPEVVENAVRQDGRTQVLLPSRGASVTASSRPMSEWKYNPGDRRGYHWGYFRRKGRRYRVFEFDANFWKSFCHTRLASVPGEPGSLSLFGRDPTRHQLYADHLAAEVPKEVECQGRRVKQWENPRQADNHWLDCTVGTLAAASYLGAELIAGTLAPQRKPPSERPRLADLIRR